MTDDSARARFERLVLPHMDAAYNLAIWLIHDPEQAQEAVQEAYLRAFRFSHALRGDDARPWLLGIVRNVCYTLLARERKPAAEAFDEDVHGEDAMVPGAVLAFPVNPEAALMEKVEREQLHAALRALAPEYREVLVLRELHECSYREIAAIAAIPLGTVMSRLARARRLLQQALCPPRARKETGT